MNELIKKDLLWQVESAWAGRNVCWIVLHSSLLTVKSWIEKDFVRVSKGELEREIDTHDMANFLTNIWRIFLYTLDSRTSRMQYKL